MMRRKTVVWQKSRLLSLIGLLVLMRAVPVRAQTCVPPPSGLISWWPGDGDATDIIGPNNGTQHGSATFAKGLVGEAFSFDGSRGTFVDATTVGLPVGNNSRTLEMWIRIERYVPDAIDALFAGYGRLAAFNEAYVLGSDHEPNGVFFFSQ